MSLGVLEASAYAFAFIGFADGALTPEEDEHFREFIGEEGVFEGLDAEARDAAWSSAMSAALKAGEDGDPLLIAIGQSGLEPADKAVVLRAARAAVKAERGGARRNKEAGRLEKLEKALAG